MRSTRPLIRVVLAILLIGYLIHDIAPGFASPLDAMPDWVQWSVAIAVFAGIAIELYLTFFSPRDPSP